MPQIRPEIIIKELYHVYNRGVDKKVIFPTQKHYLRFVSALRFFNTTTPIVIREYNAGIRSLNKGERLVDICAFILMPTHYHLLLRPRIKNGLSLFMQKIGTGFTSYFNLTNDRSGVLFQGRYKIKHINKDNYARHILAYIPLNALDSEVPQWREEGIGDIRKAKKILLSHPWSSFSSYMSKKEFKDIINKNFIEEFFDNPLDYERFVLSRTIHEDIIDTGIESL